MPDKLSRSRSPDRKNHFTLVELMIVVAIIAVLAAIAIPSFAVMQLRAKRSEAGINLDAVLDAGTAYQAAIDQAPPGDNTEYPRDWDSLDKKAVAWTTGNPFDVIGWRPDGKVRCNYIPWTPPGDGCDVCGTGNTYEVHAHCDVDDDNVMYFLCGCNLNTGTKTWFLYSGSSESYY